MSTEITTFDQAVALKGNKAIDFFSNKENIDPLIQHVKEQALAETPDVSTKKGRDAIGSNALKVSKSRKALTQAIDKSVADLKSKVQTANEVKKHVTEELNALRTDILKPRDEWQAEQDRIEAERKAEIQGRITNIRLLGEYQTSETKEELASRIEALNAMDVSEGFAEFTQEAMKAVQEGINNLNARVQQIVEEEVKAEQERQMEAERRKLQITERIQKLQGIPLAVMSGTAKDVSEKLEAVRNNPPKAEEFDDQFDTAQAAYTNVISQLEMMFDQKTQLEKMQARQQAEQEEALKAAQPEPELETEEEQQGSPFALPESEHAVFNDVIADAHQNGAGNMVVSEDGLSCAPQEEVMNSIMHGEDSDEPAEDHRISDIACYLESTVNITPESAMAVAVALVSGGVPHVSLV